MRILNFNVIRPEDIFTFVDLACYHHQRLGDHCGPLPGVVVSPFAFSLLDPMLSRVWRIDPPAFQDLIVVPFDSGFFVTTHIETNHAGERVCGIFAKFEKDCLEQEFTENLRAVVFDQHRNHRRWIADGKGFLRLVPANAPQPSLTFGED